MYARSLGLFSAISAIALTTLATVSAKERVVRMNETVTPMVSFSKPPTADAYLVEHKAEFTRPRRLSADESPKTTDYTFEVYTANEVDIMLKAIRDDLQAEITARQTAEAALRSFLSSRFDDLPKQLAADKDAVAAIRAAISVSECDSVLITGQ